MRFAPHRDTEARTPIVRHALPPLGEPTMRRPTGLPPRRQRGSLRHLPGKRARPSPPGRLSLPSKWLPTWINLAEYVGARRSYGYGDALESSRRVCLGSEVGCRSGSQSLCGLGLLGEGRAPPFARNRVRKTKAPCAGSTPDPGALERSARRAAASLASQLWPFPC